MRIIIGITHPKHIHMFKHFIRIMEGRGHKVLCLVNDKEYIPYFLSKYGFNNIVIGKNNAKLLKKLLQIPLLLCRTLKHSYVFKPDIFIGQAFLHFAYISRVLGKPFLILEDTEVAQKLHHFVIPFADVVFTTSYFKRSLGKNEIKLKCNYELFYLHPKYFRPDPKSLDSFGLHPEDKYSIVRFVSWDAYHDMGVSGLTLENKILACNTFAMHGKVLISSESSLPKELIKYHVDIPPDKMHDLMYYSTLYFGESATMAAESACLGTPAIYLDENGRGYTDEMEELYKLLFNFKTSDSDQLKAIAKGEEILSTINVKNVWQKRREVMLHDKIDINEFLVWFVEKYPSSKQQLLIDSSSQDRFLDQKHSKTTEKLSHERI